MQHPESVPVTLARLEGKVDAVIAVQEARSEEHGRRLEVVDMRLNAHSTTLSQHATALAAIPPAAPRISPWQVAAVVVAAVSIPTTIILAMAGWLVTQLGGA